jgi:hypothetical protein
MTKNTRNLRIGDIVTGTYHGIKFQGEIRCFDVYGSCTVALTSPITVYGSERDSVHYTHQDRRNQELVIVDYYEGEGNTKQISQGIWAGSRV